MVIFLFSKIQSIFQKVINIFKYLDPRVKDVGESVGEEIVHAKNGKAEIKLKDLLGSYKAFLYFEEAPQDKAFVISNQYIRFNFLKKVEHISKESKLFHIAHYPCQHKVLCNINEQGMPKTREKYAYHCQEILARDGLIETLFYIVARIHNTEVVEKKKPITVAGRSKWLPGWHHPTS